MSAALLQADAPEFRVRIMRISYAARIVHKTTCAINSTGHRGPCTCGAESSKNDLWPGAAGLRVFPYEIEPLPERPTGGGDIPPPSDDGDPTDVEAWYEVDH